MLKLCMTKDELGVVIDCSIFNVPWNLLKLASLISLFFYIFWCTCICMTLILTHHLDQSNVVFMKSDTLIYTQKQNNSLIIFYDERYQTGAYFDLVWYWYDNGNWGGVEW